MEVTEFVAPEPALTARGWAQGYHDQSSKEESGKGCGQNGAEV